MQKSSHAKDRRLHGVTVMSRRIVTFSKSIVAALVCLASMNVSEASEIKALVALGFKDVMEDVGAKFEKASGNKLAMKLDNFGAIVKMVQGGEAADIIIMPRQGIDTIVKDGKAVVADVTDLARSEIVIVVRKGASKPDVSSADALKRTLLAAKSITYGNPADGGASGIHFAKVIDRLGIASELKAKTIYSKPGRDTGDVVAAGKAELGVNQLQVLMPVTGIEVAGPLPGDLQAVTIFSAVIPKGAKNAAAAQALVKFLRTPEAVQVIKAKGMNSL